MQIAESDLPEPPKPSEPAEETRLQVKRKRKDQRLLVAGKGMAGLLAVLVFLATGGGWGLKEYYDSKFTEVAALDEDSKDIQQKEQQLGDENFLILGSDTRQGAPKGDGIGTEETVKGARSDTLMIAHLPKDRSRAVLVSFPRDLEITRPECKRWDSKTGEYSDELVPETPQQKLNSAYAVGGPKCVIKWVQRHTGLKMNHFVGVDFGGFKGMVDAVGGVEVEVDGPIVDEVVGTIAEKAGVLKLNGDRALDFVRARKVVGDPTADYGRIKRQQKFIAALLTKTMSSDVLLDTGKLGKFVDAFAEATFGDNVGVDEMLKLAGSLQGLDAGGVEFMTVPTTGYSNDRGNEELIDELADELYDALIHNKPLPKVGPGGRQDDGADGDGEQPDQSEQEPGGAGDGEDDEPVASGSP